MKNQYEEKAKSILISTTKHERTIASDAYDNFVRSKNRFSETQFAYVSKLLMDDIYRIDQSLKRMSEGRFE